MNSFLARETNPRHLAVVRIIVGVVAAIRGAGYLLMGADALLLVPWIALSVMMIVGWRSRLAAVAMLGLAPALMLGDGVYNNHFYLLILAIMFVALLDCERHYAVRPRGTGPVMGWPLLLMRAQLSIVYTFAGLAKLNEEFLTGVVLQHHFEQAVIVVPGIAAAAVPLAFATIALELFMGLGVWSRRLRPLVIGVVLPLHLGMFSVAPTPNDVLGVGVFAVLMFVLFSAFLELPERGRLVVWDGDCSSCRTWIAAFRRLDRYGALRFVSASDPAAYDGTGVTPAEAARALQLVEPDGRVRRGFEAVGGVLEVLPGGMLLAPYFRLPGVQHVGIRAYEQVAQRRVCSYQPATLGATSTAEAAPSERA